jgi:hypothetical protein
MHNIRKPVVKTFTSGNNRKPVVKTFTSGNNSRNISKKEKHKELWNRLVEMVKNSETSSKGEQNGNSS